MPKHSSRLAGNFAGLGEKAISIAVGNCHARQNQALRGVHSDILIWAGVLVGNRKVE
jgi:hypothetical protein